MPDMQSALLQALENGKREFLQRTINSWDAHEQTIRSPQPQAQPKEKAVQTIIKTGNLSRDLFDYIQQNLATRAQVVAAITNLGYIKKSAQSIITQMLKTGMLTYNGDKLVPTVADYVPVANPTKTGPVRLYRRRKQSVGNAAKSKKAAAVEAPASTLTVTSDQTERPPMRLTRLQSAAEVVANMSVIEAHKLYVELGKMFGGK